MVKTEATIQEILAAMHLPQSSTRLPNPEIGQSSDPDGIEPNWADEDTNEGVTNETVDWPESPD